MYKNDAYGKSKNEYDFEQDYDVSMTWEITYIQESFTGLFNNNFLTILHPLSNSVFPFPQVY